MILKTHRHHAGKSAATARRLAVRVTSAVFVATLAMTHDIAAQRPGQAGALVSGQVYDSIARQRIPGVTVQLANADAPGSGRPFTAVTDSSGRYSIPGVPPGRYLAGFFHMALDTLGLELPARMVTIGSGSERVDLAIPSPRTIMRTVCPTVNADSTGLFMGTVRSTEQLEPLQDATVTVEWSDYVLDRMFIYERPRQTSVQTTSAGWFAFCGLPTDATLNARAVRGADSSGYIEVDVAAAGLRHQTFHVGGARHAVIPPDPALAAAGLPPMPVKSVLRGDARLTGTVIDPNGRPVPNAHVIVWGTNVDVTTSDRGAFAIDGLPGGTHTLEVRVIGYTPVTRVVQLAASRPATIEIRLAKAATILATETIRGQLVYSRQLQEFEQRRKSGFGKYITTDQIDRRPHARLGQLLDGVLGMYVRWGGINGTSVLMRGGMGSYCVPTLYVDGNRDLSNDFDYLYADEIAGIEVYTRESERPAGYTDSNRCGAVLVWTRARAVKPRK